MRPVLLHVQELDRSVRFDSRCAISTRSRLDAAVLGLEGVICPAPAGTWVLMRTDWSKRTDPVEFLNMKQDGSHVPGPSVAAVTSCQGARHRRLGVEAVAPIRPGLRLRARLPGPCDHHGSKQVRPGQPDNLDQLPPTGTVLVTAPLKIENGSGSPLRVLALVAT